MAVTRPMLVYGRPAWVMSYPASAMTDVAVVQPNSAAVKAALAAMSDASHPVVVLDSLSALVDSIAKEGK